MHVELNVERNRMMVNYESVKSIMIAVIMVIWNANSFVVGTHSVLSTSTFPWQLPFIICELPAPLTMPGNFSRTAVH